MVNLLAMTITSLHAFQPLPFDAPPCDPFGPHRRAHEADHGASEKLPRPARKVLPQIVLGAPVALRGGLLVPLLRGDLVLGDAVAEAIYADENQIYIFDGVTGNVNLTQPRASGTLIEYPVVAAIDNDASAEIVYVSNYGNGAGNGATVSVTRDAMDRWIPARRIWNQYSYHVTNVREDGTIPPVMKKSWENPKRKAPIDEIMLKSAN